MKTKVLRITISTLLAAVFFTIGYTAGSNVITSDPVPVYEFASQSELPQTPTPSIFVPSAAPADIYKIQLDGSALMFYKNNIILMQTDIITDSLPYDDISQLSQGITSNDYQYAAAIWESFVG